MTLWDDLSPCRWPFTANHAQTAQTWEIWIQKLLVGLVADLLAGWILQNGNAKKHHVGTVVSILKPYETDFAVFSGHHLAVDIAISCSWRTSVISEMDSLWRRDGWHEMCPTDWCNRRVHHTHYIYIYVYLIYTIIYIYMRRRIYCRHVTPYDSISLRRTLASTLELYQHWE
jgi:hypothetical protein